MQKKNFKNKFRSFKRKSHNFILKTITGFAGVMALTSACAVDSPSWIPMIIFIVCMTWLFLFAYANGMMNDYGDEEW
jgi:hypothetical protein